MSTKEGPIYFYRNPLEAAYMNLKFGMKFTHGFFCEITVTKKGFFFPRELAFQNDDESTKLYIRPDSYHILEPQDSDIGVDKDGIPGLFEDGKFRTDEGLDIGECEIIFRKLNGLGVPFFAPEKEVWVVQRLWTEKPF